ncbi:hypothetical protein [Umezawaea sp. Da 62-37]|uniref:hypothetical protein n=1 Tax=Umezawaea sp. Da 62-37 TaxID=3075927 RepID=UPI0028F6EEFD|nr:hypothetical protein [Umezawaea sp. Da 62-37]WNV83703.1 hypothetical protein RM788_36805 [Umezawaea sp. Da 62-37]
MNAVDDAAVAEFPEIAMLLIVRDGGWRFLPQEPDRDQLDGFRQWPEGWRDGLRVRSGTDALGIRTNPDGDIVWERSGTLTDVVTELLSLPAPGDPSAPYLIIGSGPGR